jgi:hypothetical protein
MRVSSLLALLMFAAFAAASENQGAPPKTETASEAKAMQPGLAAHYFRDAFEWDGHWKAAVAKQAKAADYTFREYVGSRIEPHINHLIVNQAWFSVKWCGYLQVPPGQSDKQDAEVDVAFELWADDGVRMWLDGKQLIDDWKPTCEKDPGSHRTASAKLAPGYHRIVVEYFQGESLKDGDHDPAKLYWTIAAAKVGKQIIPASHFFHAAEDEKDYVPSQGLSAADAEKTENGKAAPKKVAEVIKDDPPKKAAGGAAKK